MSENDDQQDTGGGGRGLVAALIVLVALLAGGLWLARSMSSDAQIQDCVQSGRSNCSPIAGGK